MAKIYAVFGRHLPVIRLRQGIGDSVACAMIAVTAKRLFGGAAGWAAGLLAAFYGRALFFIADIQKSSLDYLLVSAVLFGAVPPERELSLNRCAVSGIVAGLLALNRENALVLIVPVALWCYARSSRTRLAAVAVVCAAAVVLVPVGLRNWEVGGEFHLTTSQLGPNLYIGNNPQADGTYVPLVKGHGSAEYEQDDATDLAQAALGRTLTAGEVSAYWRDRALNWIRAHPGRWLGLTGKKVMLFLNRTEPADTEDPYTHAETSGVLWLALMICNFGIIAPLALFGVYTTRSRWRDCWLLYGLFGLYAATVLPFFVLDRYRFPVVPICLMFAGAALALAPEWWRRAEASRRMIVATAIVGFAVLCNWPLQTRAQLEALTNYNIGSTLQSNGDNREAVARYRRAIALDPTLAEAHWNLGIVLAANGQHTEAIQEYERALQVDPSLTEANVNLGVEEAQRGEYAQAMNSLRAALAVDPNDAKAHYSLGLVLATLGRSQEARSEFETTIRLAPTDAAARNNFGILFAQTGQLDQAIEQFKAARSIRPDFKEAAANLARAEAEKGPR